MLIFIDTSSLIKRYIEETGSPDVDKLFSEENDIAIAAITPLETHSALNRKLRENTVSQEAYEKAIGFLKRDFDSFTIVPFSPRVVKKAGSVIESHGARTLDAIQIGAALAVNPDRIVTSDRRMFEILQSFEADKIQMI